MHVVEFSGRLAYTKKRDGMGGTPPLHQVPVPQEHRRGSMLVHPLEEDYLTIATRGTGDQANLIILGRLEGQVRIN